MHDARTKILKRLKRDMDKFCREQVWELAAYSRDVRKYIERTLPAPFKPRRATKKEIAGYKRALKSLSRG